MGTKSAWTPERRAKQAKTILGTRPWEKSTGPRTEGGKAISSRNAYAGDWLHEIRAKQTRVMQDALLLFGRKRWPKQINRKTG